MTDRFIKQTIPQDLAPDLQRFLQQMQLDIEALQTYQISKSIKTMFTNGTIAIPQGSPGRPPISLSNQYTVLVLGSAAIISPAKIPSSMQLTRLDNGSGFFGVFKVLGYGSITFTSTNQLTVVAIPL